MGQPTLLKRSIAELIGTYILVFLGTGAVVITVLLFQGGEGPPGNDFFVGIGMAGWWAIGIAFGIAVIAMIYTFGHISGTHINPAVTIGLWSTGRFPTMEAVWYIVAQLIGAALASMTIVLILGDRAVDSRAPAGFAGLSIGLVVAGDIVVFGNITGSSLNPARTFGPYLSDTLFGGDNLWDKFPIYVVGPIVGAILAAWIYDYIAGTRNAD